MLSSSPGPIGVFDSGYGGLTILNSIRQQLPQYDYLYLGDNARAPYGPRSFDVVYEFTRQAVLQPSITRWQPISKSLSTAWRVNSYTTSKLRGPYGARALSPK